MNIHNSAANPAEDRNRRYLRIVYLSVALTAALVAGAMLWVYHAGHRMTAVQGRLVHAAMEVQLEATVGHLWLEEAVSGDTTIDINDVLGPIDLARWYAGVMLEGGEDTAGTFTPLSDRPLAREVEEVAEKIARLRELAELRWAQKDSAGVGSPIDQEYDAVFKSFLDQAGRVDAHLHKAIGRDLAAFQTLQATLIAAVLAIMATVGVFFSRFLRRQMRDADSLRAANQHLDAANQQLLATQQQLGASNQQLRAQEQQLRASNQQLMAGEQQLRAANQQLAATNQQLRASREELAGQYEFLHHVFESLDHPFYVINAADYTVEAANSASGLREGDEPVTCHRLVHGLDHPCDEDAMVCPVREVCESGQPMTVEHTHYDERGMPRFMEIHAYPVRDASGRVTRVIESIHDVTQRRVAEQRVRDMAKFPSENPNPVLRIDDSGTIVYANAAAGPLLEKWGTAPGRSVPSEYVQFVVGALHDGCVRQTEVNLDAQILLLAFAPVRESNYVNVYGLDVTGRIEAQDQLRRATADLEHMARLTTVGQLASGLAHELNQPLCAILNYANTGVRLIKGANDSPQRIGQALEQIAFQADRAGEIIRRMRHLIGKREVTQQTLDVNDVVREVLALMQGDARDKRVTILTNLAENLPPVQADDVQVGQVVLNFLRNAFDALVDNPSDDRIVRIRTSAEQGVVMLSVCDNGVGLSAGQAEKVFDSFYSTKKDGLGVGLSLSRSIIEAHNGHIKAEPGGDRGATFSFTLPIADQVSQSVPR